MTRKQFLQSALNTCAATLGLTVLASCGSGPSAPAPDGGRSGSDAAPAAVPAVTIGDNHGHVMVVSQSDVLAAQQKSYSIRGTSDHDHTVLLTQAEFEQLAGCRAIMTTSTFDADHDHSILVACA